MYVKMSKKKQKICQKLSSSGKTCSITKHKKDSNLKKRVKKRCTHFFYRTYKTWSNHSDKLTKVLTLCMALFSYMNDGTKELVVAHALVRNAHRTGTWSEPSSWRSHVILICLWRQHQMGQTHGVGSHDLSAD